MSHGLQVSPNGDSDNAFTTIKNDGVLHYKYEIPSDHPSGLFWYHPHAMPNVAMTVAAGLYGAIIIEDDFDQTR